MERLNEFVAKLKQKSKGEPQRTPQARSAVSLPARPLPANLEGICGPFTWDACPIDPDMLEYQKDHLGIVGRNWELVTEKLALAHGLACTGRADEGRAHLVDLYSLLLPHPFFHSACPVINDHREALRHMLDATWIGIHATQCDFDNMSFSDAHRFAVLLQDFLKNMTPFSRLDARQQAAIIAVEAVLTDKNDLLKKSMALDPGEGAWPYYLGCLLKSDRTGGVCGMKVLNGSPSAEEVSLLRVAHRLGRMPSAGPKLAKSLADTDRKGRLEAEKLVDEALAKHPDDVGVLYHSAWLLLDLHPTKSKSPLQSRAEALFRRCVTLAGRPCATLHMDLCLAMCEGGRRKEARRELREALRINRDAICQGRKEVPTIEMMEMSGAARKIFGK